MKLVVTTALLMCVLIMSECKELSTTTDSGYSRAQQTLNGLVDYFWNHDPVAKNISFFFACGQIGGQGSPADWTKCSCNNQASCLNCYRWWDAVAMESLATYGIYTNTSNHSNIPALVFDHSPYNGEFSGYSYTFIDDFAWYGIAYLRVYEWLNVRISKLWFHELNATTWPTKTWSSYSF